jgi:prepilin-type N-terminal cleavage/methylation domain-containing protein
MTMASARHRRSAFTLLELLLALAVLVAVAAISWPALQRPLATQHLRRAAEQVRTQWIKTRTKAINTGETYSFRYQADSGKFRVEAQSQEASLLESAAANMSPQAGAGGSGGMSSQSTSASAAPSKPAVPAKPAETGLPDGVKFAGGDVTEDGRSAAIASQERSRGSVDLSWSQPIFFYPDGTATAARVALVGEGERAIVIELRSLTGGARIGEIVSQESLRP